MLGAFTYCMEGAYSFMNPRTAHETVIQETNQPSAAILTLVATPITSSKPSCRFIQINHAHIINSILAP